MTAPPPVLRFRDLSLGYSGRPVLRHLDGDIEAGSLLALVGPNGAGKSTLLNGIVGRLAPLEGAIERPASAARQIAVVPQRADLDRGFPMSLRDLVGAGLWPRSGAFKSFGTAGERDVRNALHRVGLIGLGDRSIGKLSGGQFQRALFARMIVQDARVILLDEPFASIDEDTTADLLAMILNWHREGRTIIAALHDLDQVRAYFPETLLLAGEPVAWGRTNAVLAEGNLARAHAVLGRRPASAQPVRPRAVGL